MFTNFNFGPSRKARQRRRSTRWTVDRLDGIEMLEPRLVLSTITLTGTTVTVDETTGLQKDDTNTALPTAFSTRLTALGAPATEINHAVSSGNVFSISGVMGTVGNIAFRDASGGALDGDSSGLSTTDGKAILLYTDPANDNIVLGKTADGAIAFAVYIEETGSPVSGGKFWSVQYAALKHPDTTNPDDLIDLNGNLRVAVSETTETNFNFAGAPSGSNLFMTFGDPNSAQIVVIGKDPLNQSEGGNITTKDVLNISQAGSTTSFGVNGNQLNPSSTAGQAGEGAYITYVTGTNTNFLVPNLDQNEADVEANIDFQNVNNSTGASFTVNQTNPGVGPVTVRITAFSTAAEPGVNFVDGLTNDSKVAIATASVVDFVVKSGKTQFTPVATVNPDGTLTITGLSTGDKVSWTTNGTHNRVLIENLSNADSDSSNNNNTFDIGGFSLINTNTNTASALVGTAVKFADDGPTIATGTNPAALIVDETTLGTDASGSFTSLFNASFGADGKANTGALTYALGIGVADANSGLIDTATGNSVFLFLSGGGTTITGNAGTNLATAAAGPTVFVISLDATGSVTLDQQRAVVHSPNTGPDQSVSLADGVVTLTATAKDGDGDTTAKTENIGDRFTFKDDAPSVSLTAATPPSLTVDETNLAVDDTKSFAGQFSAVGGADGLTAAGLIYTLSITAGSTGLTDTATGQAVVLSVNASGVVEGRTATSSDLVFTVSVAINGDVTLDQKRAVKHPDTTNPDDSVSLGAANLVQLTATATDKDGDTDSKTLNIGQLLNFKDDGPTVSVDDVTGSFDTTVKSGTWSILPGADVFKSLNITLNSYAIGGHSTVTANMSLGTVTSTDSNGNYVFTGSITDDFTDDGVVNQQTVTFKLTFHPGDGTYDFQVTSAPSSTTTLSSAAGSLDAGGPDPVRTLTIGTQDIVFSAVNATTNPTSIQGFLNASEAAIQAGAGYLSPAQMNVSTAGIGLGNNNFDGNANAGIDGATTKGGAFDESFVVDPHFLVSSMKIYIDNSVGGYNPATEGLFYRIYFQDGTVSAPIKVTAGDLSPAAGGQVSFLVGSASGPNNIDAVQLFMGSGTIKIPVIEFNISTVTPAQPLSMDFTAKVLDGDDDSSQDTFSVKLT